MDLPCVVGSISRDYPPRSDKFILTVVCPYCSRDHGHGLGEAPMIWDKAQRTAECLGGDYILLVKESMSKTPSSFSASQIRFLLLYFFVLVFMIIIPIILMD